mmetsp:Transcript_3398/g.8051  ORF Transcript_3398/g.8051 Transcript_3398/m.8051 type:complete len:226 (+) Transcript_3398:377-1054(+)
MEEAAAAASMAKLAGRPCRTLNRGSPGSSASDTRGDLAPKAPGMQEEEVAQVRSVNLALTATAAMVERAKRSASSARATSMRLAVGVAPTILSAPPGAKVEKAAVATAAHPEGRTQENTARTARALVVAVAPRPAAAGERAATVARESSSLRSRSTRPKPTSRCPHWPRTTSTTEEIPRSTRARHMNTPSATATSALSRAGPTRAATPRASCATQAASRRLWSLA